MGVLIPSSKIAKFLVAVCIKMAGENSQHAKDVGNIVKESRFGRPSIIH